MKPVRRSIAGIAAAALSATGLTVLGVATAPSAHAEEVSIDDAVFRWGINKEAGSAGFAPGTWNLMSAGKLGDPGQGGMTLKTADEGATWSNGTTAGWKNTEGNVTIEDLLADDTYAPTTFLGTRQNSAGQQVNTGGISSENQLVFRNGTGTADVDANTASIQWDGDATVVYYSGMTFFYVSDPEMTVNADGTGEVTATLGGFATSMDDMSIWEPLPDEEVTLATLTDAEVTTDGVEVTPDYHEVTYDAPGTATPQVRTGANWGSFPQSYVDWVQQTGGGSYWYSSGGAADVRKPTLPLSAEFSIETPAPTPTVQVSETEISATGEHEITVTGTGFDPALATGARPPLAGKPSGAYIAFGKFADNWKPSTGAPSSARKTGDVRWAVLAEDMGTIGGPSAGAVELHPDGSFEATLTVDKDAIDAAATDPSLVNYGVYTYPGGGATQPAYETYTPITFTDETELVTGSLRTAWGAKPTPSKAGKYTAKVTGGGAVGVEKFTVEVKDAAGKVVETRTSAAPDATGRAKDIPLAKRMPGTYTVTVTYPGDDTIAETTFTEKLTVAKVKGAMRSAWVRKPTAKKAGAITVKLTGAGVGPATGRFTVQVKNAKGKVVETRKPRLDKTGRAQAIPLKKRARGNYTVVVSYAGNANLKASSLKVKFAVK